MSVLRMSKRHVGRLVPNVNASEAAWHAWMRPSGAGYHVPTCHRCSFFGILPVTQEQDIGMQHQTNKQAQQTKCDNGILKATQMLLDADSWTLLAKQV